MKQEEHRYDDIIDRPHPVSARHPRMPLSERAAQFAPFAALTGFGEVIGEAALRHDRLFSGGSVPEDEAGQMASDEIARYDGEV